jgi:hypothetical protein
MTRLLFSRPSLNFKRARHCQANSKLVTPPTNVYFKITSGIDDYQEKCAQLKGNIIDLFLQN